MASVLESAFFFYRTERYILTKHINEPKRNLQALMSFFLLLFSASHQDCPRRPVGTSYGGRPLGGHGVPVFCPPHGPVGWASGHVLVTLGRVRHKRACSSPGRPVPAPEPSVVDAPSPWPTSASAPRPLSTGTPERWTTGPPSSDCCPAPRPMP